MACISKNAHMVNKIILYYDFIYFAYFITFNQSPGCWTLCRLVSAVSQTLNEYKIRRRKKRLGVNKYFLQYLA